MPTNQSHRLIFSAIVVAEICLPPSTLGLLPLPPLLQPITSAREAATRIIVATRVIWFLPAVGPQVGRLLEDCWKTAGRLLVEVTATLGRTPAGLYCSRSKAGSRHQPDRADLVAVDPGDDAIDLVVGGHGDAAGGPVAGHQHGQARCGLQATGRAVD